MSIVQLDFAEPFFWIDYVEAEKDYYVGPKSIVINLAEVEQENIQLRGERKILPLKAAVVEAMQLTRVVRAMVIKDFERCNLEDPEMVEALTI